MKKYDIVVLGGGPGGYAAGIRAAQLGKSVALIEKERLGGTCLHKGCIPSKSLLRSAEVYKTLQQSESYGITTAGITLDFEKVQARKQKIIEQLHTGIVFLMKKNKIDVYTGTGRLTKLPDMSEDVVSVVSAEGQELTLSFERLIIATGSRPKMLPDLVFDGTYVMTSDDALEMTELPKSIIIVGGGVIGVEWASMLHDFGVDVSIVEYAERLIPLEDADVSKELKRLLLKRGVKIMTGTKFHAESVTIQDGMVKIQVEQKGVIKQLQADKVLVSVGRHANVEQIGLEHTAVKVDRNVIVVDSYMQTTDSRIYAIGDVNGGLQLAHVASHEGIIAAEHICGKKEEVSPLHLIPRCIYGRPEIASVGWTEEQAVEQGHNIKIGKFSFKAIGKALVHGDSDGFVKVIVERQTDEILGVHMIGPHVTDFISEAALAQLLHATSIKFSKLVHPHPSLSEILGEAMISVNDKAIGM